MREERRISLRSLARRLGISAAFLVDLEKDRRQPTPQLMQKLADEIDVPLSDFDKFSPDLPKAVKGWISANPLVGRALKALDRLPEPESAVSSLEAANKWQARRRFPIAIYESELQAIGFESSSWDTETGGDLFGLWGDIPIIYLATRSGPKSTRDQAHFRLDVEYLIALSARLDQDWGLRYFGDWHSHHRLGLTTPSTGDRARIQRLATKNNFHEMAELIVTFSESFKQDKAIRVHPYAYLDLPSDDLTDAAPVILTGESPIRSALRVQDGFPEQHLASFSSYPLGRVALPREPLPRVSGSTGPALQPVTDRLVRRLIEELEQACNGQVELHAAPFGFILVAPVTEKDYIAFAIDGAWPHRILQTDRMDRHAGTTHEMSLTTDPPSIMNREDIVKLYHAAKESRAGQT